VKPLPFKVRQETATEKWRAETFWDKEPETIAWIDSFLRGQRFLDIGANIGLYSLYAAKRRVNTISIEPHPGNFEALVINQRFLNRALPMRAILGGAGRKDEMQDFWFYTVEAGTTGGSHILKAKHRQHVRVYTVDYLMNLYGPLDHIKIDVDGEELQIVQGMKGCLTARTFRSCLIEVGPLSKDHIVEALEKAGYTRGNEFNTMTPHSRERRKEEGIQVENIVFVRSE
jgi:FkbM family methyltransferase